MVVTVKEIIFRNDARIILASCCDKEDCAIIMRAFLHGEFRFVPLYNKQNVSNIKMKRLSDTVKNNWKIIYFDTNTIHICCKYKRHTF